MSKSKAKKPVLSDEERRARMAALTSDVAAINLLDGGRIPVVAADTAPPVEPPPAAPAPVAEPAAKPAAVTELPVAAAAAPPLAAAPPATAAVVPPPATRPAAPTPPAAEAAADEESADRGGEEAPAAAAVAPPTGELDVAALFATVADKKDTTLRITAAHQQFFSQLGVVLGNGASAPDIIHNILTQFRAQHEAALSRLVRRALTKQFR